MTSFGTKAKWACDSQTRGPFQERSLIRGTGKRVIKAGPMPKSKAKPKGKKAPNVRPKVTK